MSNSSAPASSAPNSTDVYAPAAEFYDLSSRGNAEKSALLTEALNGVDPSRGPVLDLGAGTGLAVSAVAKALPTARILAVEPSTAMRTVLTSRVAADDDLRPRVTVLSDTAQDVRLPDSLCAAVLFGMIGHLDREARAGLWGRLAERLPAGAPVVIETIPLSAPAAMAEMHFAHEALGENTYDGWISGEPAGPDLMRWRTRWVVSHGKEVLRTVEHVNSWYVLGINDLIKETGWRGRALSAQVGVLYR